MSTSTLANTAQVLLDSMTPKFAVSYLRVSTRGQAERGGGHDEGFSIPAQREANKKKAMSMGAIVGKEFVDRGASAKSADRPQLQAMLEYVKENADRVDYVIVHKVDRLARNRDDDSDIMRTLRECGVQLVSASESIDDTPAGSVIQKRTPILKQRIPYWGITRDKCLCVGDDFLFDTENDLAFCLDLRWSLKDVFDALSCAVNV